VEMAGIEPASERIDPRTSTSVANLVYRSRQEDLQNMTAAIRSGPKALFRNPRGVGGGNLTLWRPLCYRSGSGAGRRDLRRGHLLITLA